MKPASRLDGMQSVARAEFAIAYAAAIRVTWSDGHVVCEAVRLHVLGSVLCLRWVVKGRESWDCEPCLSFLRRRLPTVRADAGYLA